ncbi:MAG: Phosphate starvation-inducible protein PhoH, predicted ATPase, partial [uncultured Sphingomonas sp.]
GPPRTCHRSRPCPPGAGIRAAVPARALVRRLRPAPDHHRAAARRPHRRARQPRPDRRRAGLRVARARRAAGALQSPRSRPRRRCRGGRGCARHGGAATAGGHRHRGRDLGAQGDDPDAQEDDRPALHRPDRLYGSARPRRADLRARPGWDREDLSGGSAGGVAADQRQRRPADPLPACGRGRRAARLPARRHEGEGRSLSPPALRRAVRHAADRAGRAADHLGRDRDRPDRLHARAHAERRLHHPRRSAEHHPAADEDVPDALRHARAHGRMRRSQPGRPARRQQVGAGRRRVAARRGQRHRHGPFHFGRCRPPPAGRPNRRRLRRSRAL